MTTPQQLLLGINRPSSFSFTAPSGGSGNSYSIAPAAVNSGEVVSFVSTTTGATGWNWNFGDGGTSTLQNPTHTYATGGTFTITLTATAASGTVVLGTGRASAVVTLVSSGVVITFNDISGSAPDTGSSIGTNYTASTGVTFPSTVLVFNRNTDPGVTPSPTTGYQGYARKDSGPAANITVDPARNYGKLTVDLGVGPQICTVYVFDAFDNVLNSALHDFSNAGGRAWTYDYVLADASILSYGFPIARISIQHNAAFWFALANIRLGV